MVFTLLDAGLFAIRFHIQNSRNTGVGRGLVLCHVTPVWPEIISWFIIIIKLSWPHNPEWLRNLLSWACKCIPIVNHTSYCSIRPSSCLTGSMTVWNILWIVRASWRQNKCEIKQIMPAMRSSNTGLTWGHRLPWFCLWFWNRILVKKIFPQSYEYDGS